MIKTMEMCEIDAAMRVADLMVSAAISAPKGSGRVLQNRFRRGR